MSVDVFGRNLERRGEWCRGPPGVGFKLTSKGQYDMEGKRLCNVAVQHELNDAINLDTLQRIVRMELQNVFHVTARLRSELDNFNLIIEGYKDKYEEKTKRMNLNIETIQDLTLKNSESIMSLDNRLNAVQNTTSKTSGGAF